MEYKLNETQKAVIKYLYSKKQELQKHFEELNNIEREQFSMIIKYQNLPDGKYEVKAVGEDIIITLNEEKEEDEGE